MIVILIYIYVYIYIHVFILCACRCTAIYGHFLWTSTGSPWLNPGRTRWSTTWPLVKSLVHWWTLNSWCALQYIYIYKIGISNVFFIFLAGAPLLSPVMYVMWTLVYKPVRKYVSMFIYHKPVREVGVLFTNWKRFPTEAPSGFDPKDASHYIYHFASACHWGSSSQMGKKKVKPVFQCSINHCFNPMNDNIQKRISFIIIQPQFSMKLTTSLEFSGQLPRNRWGQGLPVAIGVPSGMCNLAPKVLAMSRTSWNAETVARTAFL